jgi:hypothetical protein
VALRSLLRSQNSSRLATYPRRRPPHTTTTHATLQPGRRETLVVFFNTDPATIGYDLTAQTVEAGCDIIWGHSTVFFTYLESASWGNGHNHRPHMPGGAGHTSWGWHRRVCRYWQAAGIFSRLTDCEAPLVLVSSVSIDKSAPAYSRTSPNQLLVYIHDQVHDR